MKNYKKFLLASGMALLALSAGACGKKTEEAQTQAAATEASVDEETANFTSGTIASVDGSTLTLSVSDDQSISFDISGAATNPAWALHEGDEVDVYFDGETDEDTGLPADGSKALEVKMSVPYEYQDESFSYDPEMYGEITAVDDKSITVKEILDDREEASGDADEEMTVEDYYGETYTFSRASYEIDITDAGLSVGTTGSFDYLGELDSNPVCYRVVTDDKADAEEATKFYLDGTLEKVEQGVAYLKMNDDTVYKFVVDGDEDLQKQAEDLVGKEARISFSDSIRARVMTADSVEAL